MDSDRQKYRILLMNSYSDGSTKTLVEQIGKGLIESNEYLPILAFPERPEKTLECLEYQGFGSRSFIEILSNRIGMEMGLDGFIAPVNTARFIRLIRETKPALINLHNIHHYSLNLSKVLRYCAAEKVPVVLTMHDLWLATGRCAYTAGCQKFASGCGHCPNKLLYPESRKIDLSRNLSTKKKKLLLSNNITVVCVSRYLATQAEKSQILKNKQLVVISNGVDTTVFNPVQIEEQHQDHRLTIGAAAYSWSENKGLATINYLAKRLDKKKYRLVLAGNVDGRDVDPSVECIGLLHSPYELSRFYSSIDCLVFPSRDEAFGLVSLEAQACGTPVVAYDIGGISETINPGVTGFLANPFDEEEFHKLTLMVLKRGRESFVDDCLKFAQKNSVQMMKSQYLELYQSLIR